MYIRKSKATSIKNHWLLFLIYSSVNRINHKSITYGGVTKLMNYFDIKAEELERRFFRTYKKGLYFFTGTKKQNQVVNVNNKEVAIKSLNGKRENRIKRRDVKRAIAFLLYKRTGTRKDIEKYSKYSSALLGLLQVILIDIARIQKTVKGLLRLTIRGVRFFFSGLDRAGEEDRQSILEGGAQYILCSYFYLREKSSKALLDLFNFLKMNNVHMLVDSGEYSYYRAIQKGRKVPPINLREYGEFIRINKRKIWGYFNLDVTGDPLNSKRNYEWLKSYTQVPPIPVWHCHTSNVEKCDWLALEKLVEEDHELIAIGGTVHLGRNAGVSRQTEVKDMLFHQIFQRFPEQNFHWLGGSSRLLLKYPFFSADSSGWLQGRKNNQIYYFNDDDIATGRREKWPKRKCLVHNISVLASLEKMYEGIQLSFYARNEHSQPIKSEQLSLFK